MIKKGDIYLYFFLFILFYLFTGNIISIFSFNVPLRPYFRLAIGVIGIIIFVIFNPTLKIKKRDSIPSLVLFVILSAITTLSYYSSKNNIMWAFQQYGEAIAWIGTYCYFYFLASNYKNILNRFTPFILATFIYTVLFIGVAKVSAGRGIPLRTASYYTLFTLPFILSCKHKILKYSALGATAFTLILSNKRAGFIAFGLALVMCYIVDYLYNAKTSKKKFFMILSGLIFALVAGYGLIILFKNNNMMLVRMSNVIEDGGSGRTLVWGTTIEMIKNSSLIEKIFGHGFNTVFLNSPLKLSGHNDILECLYDYGIAGFVLYLIFIKNVIFTYKEVKEKYVEHAGGYMASIVIFITVSMFSHLLIFPTYFLILCAYWGIWRGVLNAE